MYNIMTSTTSQDHVVGHSGNVVYKWEDAFFLVLASLHRVLAGISHIENSPDTYSNVPGTGSMGNITLLRGGVYQDFGGDVMRCGSPALN